MSDPPWFVVSMFILIAAALLQPVRASCPHGWHNEGVRPSGSFVCKRNPIGDDHRNARAILVDDSIEPPGELYGDIYCTGGQLPIVVDDRIVGCQRGGWVQ